MPENSTVSLLKQDDNKFKPSIKELIFKYVVFLPLFIVSAGISVAVARIYLRYQIPYYSSGISVLVKDDKGSRSSSNTDALDEIVFIKPKTNLINEIEVLKSATLMERVVRELNLNTSYWIEGKFKRTETYNTRIISYESISQKDTNTGFNVVIQFKDKNHFEVEGLRNQLFAPEQVIHGGHGDFIIHLLAEGVNSEYKYIVQHQPPLKQQVGLPEELA